MVKYSRKPQAERRRKAKGARESAAKRGRCGLRLSTGSTEPRCDAVDGEQQRGQRALLPGAIPAQQLDLLAVHLVERGQPARQTLAEQGEPLGDGGSAGEALQHLDGAVVLVGEHREDLLA